MWQMANQGPKLGECGHFRRLGDREGDQTYAVRRFTDEANRLYGVLNNRLADRAYLAGNEYTIADMISYPWTVNWKCKGQDIEEFKYFKRWFEEIGKRPAVQKRHGGRQRPLDRCHQAAGRGAGPHPQDALQPARHSGAVRVGQTFRARAAVRRRGRPPSRAGRPQEARQGPALHGCDT